jgi:lipoprotein-anchoring transpeptidase ErfK/SrfK
LGIRSDALDKLQEASAQLRSLPRYERIWKRLRGTSLSRDFKVTTSIKDPDAAQAYLKEIGEEANRAPREASVEVIDGSVVVHEGQDGYALDWEASEAKLLDSALSGTEDVELIGEYTEAPATIDTENVIVVDLGDQKLYHYRNGALVKDYVIVHGGTAYPTPTGTWQISAKRINPTWRNPAKYPGGWGEHLPSVIGPGWGNPLGTRAMNLGNTLIRIHGTYKALSVNESRGCIRMKIPDSEELFERVSIGTTVVVQT